MATEIKRRRGTSTEHATFTGALGEITVDTTKRALVVHDGSRAGGYPAQHEIGQSLDQFGGRGDGTSDNATAQAAMVAAGAAMAFLRSGTYLSTAEWAITEAISLHGNGTLKTSAVDKNILSVGDAIANPSGLVAPVSLFGLTLKEQPVSADDNYAAISLANVDQPNVLACWMDDVETGIRAGHVLSGEQVRYPILALNHIDGAREFGIEHFNAQHPITIGNVIQNDGVRVGGHGLRYTAGGFGTDGFVSVGNLVADRGTNGISVQGGVEHGLISAVIKNVAEDGFRANLVSVEAQQHLAQLVVVDATQDGVDLTNLSHCMVDAVTNNSDGNGIRVGNAVDDGHHIVRQVSLDDDNATRVVSNYNHVTVVADSTDAVTAVLISGSFNIVDVIVMDSVDFSAYITGNDNIVRVVQDGGGTTTGLRIDGNRNTVQANIEDTVTITGNDNVLSGHLQGNVNNTGTGNDLTKVHGFSTRGRVTATTDANGEITITHRLKSAAWATAAVNLTMHGDNDYTARAKSVTSAGIVVVVKDAAGADVASTSVTVSWQAEYS